jgi:hypothetical protein
VIFGANAVADYNQTRPELTFTQDGDDLVVTAKVGANNSPHVLWTRHHVLRSKVIPKGGQVQDAKEQHRISLHYYVFQNRDWYRAAPSSWKSRGVFLVKKGAAKCMRWLKPLTQTRLS